MSQHAENEIIALRGEKDAYFRDDPDSPIPADKRANFKGLIYYSADPTYRVKARLDRYDRPEPTMVVTSKGTKQAYMKHGTFTFQVQGAKLRLFVYKSAEDPFARCCSFHFPTRLQAPRHTRPAGISILKSREEMITCWTLT